ncbi:MAG: glycosyltransferase [Anaerolineales bacterium]
MPEWLIGFFSLVREQIGMLLYLLVIAGNTLLNRLFLPRLKMENVTSEWPPVAVLVPARDEAHNIRRCISSLLTQDYPDFEIWALDDASGDETLSILGDLATQDARLHVLVGAPLPAGWLGKNWACQQLVESVPQRFSLLLFVDADTWCEPHALRTAVAILQKQSLDLLSLLPRQVTGSLVEDLAVPILPWALFSHFPLWLMQWRLLPSLSAAIGQFMLWRRAVYQGIGGHASVRAEIVEDMALARRTMQAGFRAQLLPGVGFVSCRMYHSAGEVANGFGKNLFAVFGQRVSVYLFIWLWLGMVFLSPWVLLPGSLWAGWPASPWLAAFSILIAFFIWGLVAHMTGLRRRVAIMYPLVLTTGLVLAFYSMFQILTRRARWKGRLVTFSLSERSSK